MTHNSQYISSSSMQTWEGLENKDYLTHSLILGVLSALGFAPFNITILVIVSFALLYAQLNLNIITNKTAFFCGIWWGLGYFCCSIYWVAFALSTDFSRFWWLIPFAVISLALFFSLYFAFAFLVFNSLPAKLKNPITFAIIITFFEWLRGYLFSGFPWNLIGYTWSSLEILQSTAFFGIYGLTFFTLFLSASLGALLYKDILSHRLYYFGSISILIIIFGLGYLRLSNKIEGSSGKNLRIVQANISHQQVWSPSYALATINKYIELTNNPPAPQHTNSLKQATNIDYVIDYVIWPESSVPYLLSTNSNNIPETLYNSINNKIIIAGGPRLEGNKLYNSIFIFQEGKIIDYYDKQKLVPFGEYIPFRGILNKILPVKKIVNGLHDFSAGNNDEREGFISSLSLLPTICYEDIFPAIMQRYPLKNTGGKIKWTVNLTNDSWFGISTAPHQHFAMARVRAIENGLPLVRAVTTGISAVFDGHGRVLGSTPLRQIGVIDIPLPNEIFNSTLYRKYYSLINYLIILGGIIMIAIAFANYCYKISNYPSYSQ